MLETLVWDLFFFFPYLLSAMIKGNCNDLSQELYVSIGWPLYRKYGHAFEVSCSAIYGFTRLEFCGTGALGS